MANSNASPILVAFMLGRDDIEPARGGGERGHGGHPGGGLLGPAASLGHGEVSIIPTLSLSLASSILPCPPPTSGLDSGLQKCITIYNNFFYSHRKTTLNTATTFIQKKAFEF